MWCAPGNYNAQKSLSLFTNEISSRARLYLTMSFYLYTARVSNRQMYSSRIYLIISYHLSIGAVNVQKLKLISWFASIFIILELVFRAAAAVLSQNVVVSSACKLFLNIIQIDRIILISIKFCVYYTRYKIQILFTFLHRARANWFEYTEIYAWDIRVTK